MSVRRLLRALQRLLASPEPRRPTISGLDAADLADHYKRQSGVGK